MTDDVINSRDFSNCFSLVSSFTSFLEGNLLSVHDFITAAKEEYKSINDRLLICMIEEVINNLEEKKTSMHKLARKLAESDYGEEYGYTLLKYIGIYEHRDKGRYMAYLLDATCHDFFSGSECIYYCRLLAGISLEALCYIKRRIQKMVLYKTDNDMRIINELIRNNLMYRANNDGYAFEREAFYLDKFALSYGDETRYKYSHKDDGIPENSKFPRRPVAITAESGTPYRG